MMSCESKTKERFEEATNGLDAARYFLDACQKGDFAKANYYMIIDDLNKKKLEQIEQDYRQLNRDEREQLRQASINIAEVKDSSTTKTIITYSNNLNKKQKQIRAIFTNNKWLVSH